MPWGGDSVILNENGQLAVNGALPSLKFEAIDYKSNTNIPNISNIFCVKNIFFIIDSSSNNKIFYSNDAINWQELVNVPNLREISSIYYINNIYIFADLDDSKIAYSTNIKTWNIVDLPMIASSVWINVCYGNNMYVISDDYGENAYSFDCINWKQGNSPKSEASSGIVYGDGAFVTVSNVDGTIYYSQDCLSWDTVDGKLSVNNFNLSLLYDNNRFMCLNGEGVFVYSDANNWKDINSWKYKTLTKNSGSYNNYGLHSLNGLVVILLDKIFISADCINWTIIENPRNPSISSIWEYMCYGNNKYVIALSNSQIYHGYLTYKYPISIAEYDAVGGVMINPDHFTITNAVLSLKNPP